MPLIGQGVLAIWNGIAPEAEAEFVAWHVREHIPERVGLPGFLRGRRYVGEGDAHPPYFNFYETDDIAALTSEAYKARLNAPSEWTRNVVKHFRDTSRTACRVAASVGQGEGGWIETFRMSANADASAFTQACSPVMNSIQQQPGIVAVHLLQGETEASRSDSAEKAMRGQPDEVVGWILLVEAVSRDALFGMERTLDATRKLGECGAMGEILRGIYQFQFGLSQAEL
jgi:hypothetical protein